MAAFLVWPFLYRTCFVFLIKAITFDGSRGCQAVSLSGRLVEHNTWVKPAELASPERPEYFFICPVPWHQTPWFLFLSYIGFFMSLTEINSKSFDQGSFSLSSHSVQWAKLSSNTGDLNSRMKCVWIPPMSRQYRPPVYFPLCWSRGKATHAAASSHVLFSYSALVLCNLFLAMLIFYSLLSSRKS